MLFLLEDCKNCVNLEKFDEPICFTSRNYTFIRELELLDEIYEIETPVIVIFVPNLERPDGTKAKGNCGIGQFITRDGEKLLYMIMLDSSLDLIEAATILIHEYAHMLSQQDHYFKMYELWREYLREEFVNRWDDTVSTNRDRIIIVGDREEEE